MPSSTRTERRKDPLTLKYEREDNEKKENEKAYNEQMKRLKKQARQHQERSLAGVRPASDSAKR